MQPRNRRGGRGNFGLLLLAGQIMQIGADRIPPVTLATVILNVLVFMRLIPNMPTLRQACTSYSKVVYKHQYKCLILSSIYHLDDMHLYYNMASFIWKGMRLENKLKSTRFAIVLIVFSVLSQVIMIGLNYLLYEALSNSSYLTVCAAGFSAVIFALKVLTTKYSNDDVSVMGFPIFVPAKYACWVELIVIQLLVPSASFTGHLAGILVGFMYTHGPLKKVIKGFTKIITGQYVPGISRNHSYTYQASSTRGNPNNPYQNNETSYHDSNNANEDEALQHAIRESLRDYRYPTNSQNHPPSYGWNIPNEPQYESRQSNPTAPPLFYDSTSQLPTTPPYPTDRQTNSLYPNINTMPTLTTPTSVPATDNANSQQMETPYDRDAIRNARLRRFEKKT